MKSCRTKDGRGGDGGKKGGRKEEEERGGKKRRGGAFREGERQKWRASMKLKAECAAGGERKTD